MTTEAHEPKKPLTQRELDVLVITAKGFSQKEVAGLLSIKQSTVNDRMRSVFLKLDVNTRVEAAVWAAKKGLV